jgi:hypothetical protein
MFKWKGTNGEAVIQMTKNTMAKRKWSTKQHTENYKDRATRTSL